MAHTISPQDLTEKFINQFTSKLRSTDLVTLLNSHLQQKDSDSRILQIDPSVLELHLELLAYENAIKVACSFPTKLAERLAQRQGNVLDPRTQTYPSVAGQTTNQYTNGTVLKTEPYYPPTLTTVQAAKPSVNGTTTTKPEPYYPPAPATVQTAKPSVNGTTTKPEPYYPPAPTTVQTAKPPVNKTELDQPYYSSTKEPIKQSGGEAGKKSISRQDSNSRNSLTHEASRQSMVTSPSPGTTNSSKTGSQGY